MISRRETDRRWRRCRSRPGARSRGALASTQRPRSPASPRCSARPTRSARRPAPAPTAPAPATPAVSGAASAAAGRPPTPAANDHERQRQQVDRVAAFLERRARGRAPAAPCRADARAAPARRRRAPAAAPPGQHDGREQRRAAAARGCATATRAHSRRNAHGPGGERDAERLAHAAEPADEPALDLGGRRRRVRRADRRVREGDHRRHDRRPAPGRSGQTPRRVSGRASSEEREQQRRLGARGHRERGQRGRRARRGPRACASERGGHQQGRQRDLHPRERAPRDGPGPQQARRPPPSATRGRRAPRQRRPPREHRGAERADDAEDLGQPTEAPATSGARRRGAASTAARSSRPPAGRGCRRSPAPSARLRAKCRWIHESSSGKPGRRRRPARSDRHSERVARRRGAADEQRPASVVAASSTPTVSSLPATKRVAGVVDRLPAQRAARRGSGRAGSRSPPGPGGRSVAGLQWSTNQTSRLTPARQLDVAVRHAASSPTASAARSSRASTSPTRSS